MARSLSVLVTLLLAVVGAVLPGARASASEPPGVTILAPEPASAVSGTVTVTFHVTMPAGQTRLTYWGSLGDRSVARKTVTCTETCTPSFTVDTTSSPWPTYRSSGTSAQVDDGQQRVRVQVEAGGLSFPGATALVEVGNGRPTLATDALGATRAEVDGRVTVGDALRFEVTAAATAADATVVGVAARTGSEDLTVVPPSAPGGPWVVTADTSGWAEGPRNIDVSVLDSRGMRSASTPFDVMVARGFRLLPPDLGGSIGDDQLALTATTLPYVYDPAVLNTWPARVRTYADGVLLAESTLTQADQGSWRAVSLKVPVVLEPGLRVLRFVVTDNRGLTESVETSVTVLPTAVMEWVSVPDRLTAGRPGTFTAHVATTYGEITSWVLRDAATDEILAARICSVRPCPTDSTESFTVTFDRSGPRDVYLESAPLPVPRPSRRTPTVRVEVDPAPTDFTGDGAPDVLARNAAGKLVLYRGNGRGGWAAPGVVVGSGWNRFSAIVSIGDHTGDLRRDLMARGDANQMYLYPGNGTGGFGAPGEPLSLVLPGSTVVSGLGDFDGDRLSDVLASDTAGNLWLYPGSSGHQTRVRVGRGWQVFTAVLSTGDFDGDGNADVIARRTDGRLMLYSGNGRGGWAAPGRQVGSGWQVFTALTGIGDFDGDGHADVMARRADGRLMLYSGNGRGGWAAPGRQVGSGWQGFTAIVGIG